MGIVVLVIPVKEELKVLEENNLNKNKIFNVFCFEFKIINLGKNYFLYINI